MNILTLKEVDTDDLNRATEIVASLLEIYGETIHPWLDRTAWTIRGEGLPDLHVALYDDGLINATLEGEGGEVFTRTWIVSDDPPTQLCWMLAESRAQAEREKRNADIDWAIDHFVDKFLDVYDGEEPDSSGTMVGWFRRRISCSGIREMEFKRVGDQVSISISSERGSGYRIPPRPTHQMWTYSKGEENYERFMELDWVHEKEACDFIREERGVLSRHRTTLAHAKATFPPTLFPLSDRVIQAVRRRRAPDRMNSLSTGWHLHYPEGTIIVSDVDHGGVKVAVEIRGIVGDPDSWGGHEILHEFDDPTEMERVIDEAFRTLNNEDDDDVQIMTVDDVQQGILKAYEDALFQSWLEGSLTEREKLLWHEVGADIMSRFALTPENPAVDLIEAARAARDSHREFLKQECRCLTCEALQVLETHIPDETNFH